MTLAGRLLKPILLLSVGACSAASQNPSITRQDLLGNVAQADASEAMRDEVSFGYSSHPDNAGDPVNVSFILKAAGRLDVEICRPSGGGDWDPAPFQCPVSFRARMPLTLEQERELRTLLAMSRPAKLSAEGPFLLPDGCGWVFHASPRFSVTFANSDGDGSFIVQEGATCASMTAAESYVDAILQKIPDQSIIRRYPFDWKRSS